MRLWGSPSSFIHTDALSATDFLSQITMELTTWKTQRAFYTKKERRKKTRPSRKKEKVEFYLILYMTLHFEILSNSINYFNIRFVWSFIENIFWFVFSLSLSLSCVSHVFLMCFSCVSHVGGAITWLVWWEKTKPSRGCSAATRFFCSLTFNAHLISCQPFK